MGVVIMPRKKVTVAVRLRKETKQNVFWNILEFVGE